MAAELDVVDPAYEAPVTAAVDRRTVNTFNFTTYDAVVSVGALLCLNSLPGRSQVWRHGLHLFHPSGDVVVSRGHAVGAGHDGFGTANLKFRCDLPFERWTVRYDGFGQRYLPADLRRGPAPDAVDVSVAFELTYTAMLPPWGHILDAVTGFHYEQNGRMTGWCRCGPDEWEYDGVAFRDRILGPKDTAGMAGHNWFNGVMEDGRAFALTTSVLLEDPKHLRGGGLVFVGGVSHAAEVVDVPRWLDVERDPAPFEMVLASELGRHVMVVEPVQSSPWTYVTSGASTLQAAVFGHDRRPGSLLLWESPSRIAWDGVAGHGHVEQSLLVS